MEQSAAKIEVVAMKAVNKGALRAMVSVRLGGAILHDFKVIKQEGQAAWVAEPSQEYTDKQGAKKYRRTIELNESLKERVTAVVLDAWEKEQEQASDDDIF